MRWAIRSSSVAIASSVASWSAPSGRMIGTRACPPRNSPSSLARSPRAASYHVQVYVGVGATVERQPQRLIRHLLHGLVINPEPSVGSSETKIPYVEIDPYAHSQSISVGPTRPLKAPDRVRDQPFQIFVALRIVAPL